MTTFPLFVQLAHAAAARLEAAGFHYDWQELLGTVEEMAQWNDSLDAVAVAEFYELHA